MSKEKGLAELLRDRGNRLTEPRLRVWEVLNRSGDHLTVEEIVSEVHKADPSINTSSVYRSLALFADLDLVRESSLGVDEGSRWELAHPDDHFHLVCRICGTVDHHEGDLVGQIREHLAVGHGFAAEEIDLVVTGVCARCATGEA
ncbi:MAG: transcriptional repressor [Actinobacteria bacterium]|nr:MAG: transcriptional repressor [Actinomycetota bacterium]REK36108.1 MAG: transcriptional repressor [Actinomycetota bacterium]